MTETAAAARRAVLAAKSWMRPSRCPTLFVSQSCEPVLQASIGQQCASKPYLVTSVASTSFARRSGGRSFSFLRADLRIHGQRRRATTQAGLAEGDNPFPLPNTSSASPYDVFHLPVSASQGDIKSRYYDLVKIYHPDRVSARIKLIDREDPDGDDRLPSDGTAKPTRGQHSASDTSAESSRSLEQAHDNFKRIRDAYTLLSDEGRRRTYDKSGWGWDPSGQDTGGVDHGTPAWKGGFPRSPEEWAAYEAWSSSIRRGAPGSTHRHGWENRGSGSMGFSGYTSGAGHDRFGWQQYAGNRANLGADWFYGYGHAHQHANNNRAPLYMANFRFIISVAILTATLGVGQYARLREESRFVSNVAEQRHHTAARSLDEARRFARSDVGRLRREEIKRRRAALSDGGGEAEQHLALEAPESSLDADEIGRGGPSGRGAYEERLRQIGRS